MPVLPRIVLAGALLLAATPFALADDVPNFDVGPGCRAAMNAAVSNSRDEGACKNDEQAAQTTLKRDWGHFNAVQKTHCVKLSTLGGPASYVELLTCLEMAKAAAELPAAAKDSGIQR